MVDRITSSVAREAILAALKDQTRAAESIRGDAARMFEANLQQAGSSAPVGPSEATGSAGFTQSIGDGVSAVNRELQAASPERLAEDLLSGKITDFHEVAVRVNRARISFDFAMEIRNKLIDAYRETMRMTV